MKIFLVLAVCSALTFAQAPQPPKKKKLLAVGAVYGFQHDSVSNGLATMWKIGHDTGLWDTYIRTDTQLITKKKIAAGNAKNLDYFDAIYIYTTGEYPLDDEQKAALLSFVHDDGKGIIGGHSAIDSNYKWPEYGEMMGAYFDHSQFRPRFVAKGRMRTYLEPIATYVVTEEFPAFLGLAELVESNARRR